MPLVFTHIGMVEHIRSELSSPAQDLITANPNFTYFGSMGPDFLYFYENDWPVVGKISSVYLDIHDLLKKITDLFKEVYDLFKTTETAAGNVADWISGGLYSSAQGLAGGLSATARAVLEKFVLDQKDFFETFSPPINRYPESTGVKKWWWSDITHHRDTAKFARELWNRSTGDNELTAYCLGYFTHMGVDLIGHTYVNLLTGGPYRNHWRRHGYVERILDTHLWQQWRGQSVFESNAHALIKFEGTGGIDEALPDKLAKLIADCLHEVYDGYNIVSGVPKEADVKRMYRLFFEWFEGICSFGISKLPPPPDFQWFDLHDFIRDYIKGAINRMPSVGQPPLLDPTDLRKWKAFLASLIKFAVWLTEMAVLILTIPEATLARLTTTQARYLIWLAMKSVHELHEKVRLSFVIGGFLHPDPEQIERYFKHIIVPPLDQYRQAVYPYEHAVPNSQQTYHLVHPMEIIGAINEPPHTHPVAANNFPWQTPLDVFTGNPPSGGFNTLKAACDFARRRTVSGMYDSSFISAKWASVKIIEEFMSDGGISIPNWNLDADRGYGWPTWDTSFEPWHDEADFTFQC